MWRTTYTLEHVLIREEREGDREREREGESKRDRESLILY